MKKLLLAIGLLISFISHGQLYSKDPLFGKTFNRQVTLYDLGYPKDTFPVMEEWKAYPHLAEKNDVLYRWDIVNKYWKAINTGGLKRVVAGNGLNQINDSVVSAKKFIDVFIIGGQSNSVGNPGGSGASLSPNPDTGTVYQYYNQVFTKVTDEVGAANSGSAWPSFGITYFNMTGRKVCFVPTGVNGTTQTAAADVTLGNWSTTGTWYYRSVSAADSALQAIRDSGYTPILKGVLWCQGESDGNGINNGLITQSTYATEFQTMINNYRAHFGSEMPFYIYRIATRVGYPDAGFSQIRASQESIASADPLKTKIVFRNSIDFPARSLFVDQYHYTQAGYNEMGRYSAETIVGYLNETWHKQEGNVYSVGNVGIGVTRPTFPFQVSSVGPPVKFTATGVVGRVLDLENTSSANNTGTGIRFYNDAGLMGQYLGTSSNSAFGPNAVIIHTVLSGPLRMGSNNNSVEFFTGSTGPIFTNIHAKMNVYGRWAFGYSNPNPDTSAIIDIQSTQLGFLFPRMSTIQQNAIVLPATGLTIFNLDSLKLSIYNGSTWYCVGSSVVGGGGSGTVSSGTQYRLAYYATTGVTASEAAAITGSRALVSDANGVPTHSTTTATELGYVSGVTSAIQTQMNLKAPLASPTFTGTVTLPSGQILIAPVLGTPASGTLTNATGLPISGITGLGTGIAAFLAAPYTAPTGITTVATINTTNSASKSANGLLISGSNITAQSVSATMPGMLSTGADTIAGAKVWTGDFLLQKTNPILTLDYGSGAGAIKFAGPSGLLSGFQFDNSYNFIGYTAGNGPSNPFISSQQATNFVGIKKTTATSTLDVGGSFGTAYVAKTANYTLTAADETVIITSGSNTQTLPTAVGIGGRYYRIINIGAGTTTLATTSSQTINGAAPGSVAAGTSITLKSDNANWVVASRTYTGTTGQVTVTNNVLSLPQSISTTSTVQFGGVGIGVAATAGTFEVSTISKFNKGISYGSTATITDGATVTFDCSTESIKKVTLGGNRTLAITNAVAGQSFTIEFIQDGTGTRTITLPATCKVANGGAGAITLSTAPGSIDILTFWYDGTNYFVNYGTNYN